MSRACVIVLDAVGAGELPDAADWGDEGSDTLGNVSRAVGGLDLPNLEALGLGNIGPLEGCPPQPYAPAVAGRLLERSKGKDTTAGHWELMGVVTPTPFPTRHRRRSTTSRSVRSGRSARSSPGEVAGAAAEAAEAVAGAAARRPGFGCAAR